MLFPNHISADHPASPVLHPRARQRHPDQRDGDGADHGREHAVDDLAGHEREAQLQDGADHAGAQHLAVGHGAVDFVVHHLADGDFEDGQEGEGRAHDAQEAAADVEPLAEELFGQRDFPVREVDERAQAGRDEGGADGVLLQLHVHEVDSEAEDHVGRRDEAADHGEGVLEAHQQGQQQGQRFIQGVEGGRRGGLGAGAAVGQGGHAQSLVVVAFAGPQDGFFYLHHGRFRRLKLTLEIMKENDFRLLAASWVSNEGWIDCFRVYVEIMITTLVSDLVE